MMSPPIAVRVIRARLIERARYQPDAVSGVKYGHRDHEPPQGEAASVFLRGPG